MVKFSVITGSLGNLGDRYTKSYKETISFEDKLKRLNELELLSGIEISQGEVEGLDVESVKRLIADNGIEISAIGIDLTSYPQYKFGSITSKVASVREESIKKLKATVDFAKKLDVGLLNIWLGQDGFDYPFQADYKKQWEHAVVAFRECADYDPNIKIALESKPREPRNRSFLDSTTMSLLVANAVDRPNVGVTIDVGHILQDGRNMAQSVVLAHVHDKLFNLHINDNYSAWDDDMIVGSVHTIEFIELFYYLEKIGYDKWCAIDIFPFRENSIMATNESLLYMDKFRELVKGIGHNNLDACLQQEDVGSTIRLIREKIFI